MILDWFNLAFKLKGSVAPIILPRVLLFSGLGFFVSVWHYYDPLLSLQVFGDLTTNVVFNLVLGLLLVFRTNAAYDRYWEGRKAWGTMVFNIRNLARDIQLSIPAPEATDRINKQAALRYLAAFAIATKFHLREELLENALKPLTSELEERKLRDSSNSPLEITFWIGNYLQQQHLLDRIDTTRIYGLNQMLNSLVEGLTSCERISRTPIPPAYAIYLKRIILIYCLGLPCYLVERMGGWTGLSVAVISFILFGIEQLGNEIENPFGRDPNDLPLDDICNTILNNVENAIVFESGSYPHKIDLQSPIIELQELP